MLHRTSGLVNVARMGDMRCVQSVCRKTWREETRRREDNIRMGLREMWWVVWSGFVWLRIGTSGELLWAR